MRLQYLDTIIKGKLLKKLTEDIEREKVDERWIQYLIIANAVDGVCTVECCQGHSRFMSANFRGYVSFMLSRRKQIVYEKEIEKLLGTYPIATIRKCYTKSNLGEDYGQHFWAKGYCCLNEITFEKYGFKDFIDNCFNPLLEKLRC